MLPLIVSVRFQVLFHSPFGVLFTFPSRYCFTIGRQFVFSFGQWSARIPTRFHVSRGTQELAWRELDFAYGDFTLCVGPFQALWLSFSFVTPRPFRKTAKQALQPLVYNAHGLKYTRFELFPFRSPLLRESVRFLFLGLLRCFTSPGRLNPPYEFRWES